MHKRLFTHGSLLALPALLFTALAVVPIVIGSTSQPQKAASPGAAEEGGIVTLYALDPLASTLCFADGKYGKVFSNQGVYNRSSDIAFNCYEKGAFTVGVEGPVVGTILDLGSPDGLQKQYGYRETVGKGQGFTSLHRKGAAVFINGPQQIKESAQLFQAGKSNASVPVKLGHIYLLRLTGERNDKAFEYAVKIMVIAYTADQSVTIRWQILE